MTDVSRTGNEVKRICELQAVLKLGLLHKFRMDERESACFY